MDCLWTTDVSGEVAGIIGLCRTAPHVAQIDEFRIDPQWQHTSIPSTLLRQVREYCSSQGCATLLVQAGSVPGWLLTLLAHSGFRPAKQEVVAGRQVYEFYLDVGRQPGAGHEQRRGILRVLLADDHSVLRKGMADLLQECADVEVVGEARDGQEAVKMALEIKPDVVLMDITMPRMDGIEATRRITSQLPRVRVVGLSMHEEEEAATAMRAAGAQAYLCKSQPSDAILAAVLQA
jgi:CheY-like chemotaxis protein/GNAT superfamily N-acetyltransferase